jgi:hypothetical protein
MESVIAMIVFPSPDYLLIDVRGGNREIREVCQSCSPAFSRRSLFEIPSGRNI